MTTEQLLAMQAIDGFGNATVMRLARYAERIAVNGFVTDKDMADFINHCLGNGMMPRCRRKSVSIDEVGWARRTARQIMAESERLGIEVISFQDSRYPKRLLGTIDENGRRDMPVVIHCKGDVTITGMQSVAIIGTQHPTREGLVAGRHLGRLFAENGIAVIGGLASGCDTAGHRGALAADKGKTIAVLPNGLDTVFPPSNIMLAKEILDNGGLLISEQPVGIIADKSRLVARDRIQTALSDAVVVIQTGIEGGTFHAAMAALKSGKPLFCVKYHDSTGSLNGSVLGNELLVKRGGRYMTSGNALAMVRDCIGETTNKEEISK